MLPVCLDQMIVWRQLKQNFINQTKLFVQDACNLDETPEVSVHNGASRGTKIYQRGAYTITFNQVALERVLFLFLAHLIIIEDTNG